MKVLILNNRYPNSRKPFVASYVRTMAGMLSAKNNVRLLVLKRNPVSKAGQLIDLIIYNLKLRFSGDFKWADVVLANHFNLYWKGLSKRLNAWQELVLHWHGSELHGSKRFQKFDLWVKDPNFVSATHIVPSQYFRRQVLDQFSELKNIVVIPSGGVDTEIFKPGPSNLEEKTGLVIGFASHLTREKGVDFLIRLAVDKERLEAEAGRPVSIKALKYGHRESQVLKDLSTAGVELIDPLPKDKMPGFYNSLDILLFLTRKESLGLVPLEAMACGVPVLCPDAFACPEYCKSGESGELFRQGDYDDYFEKLKILLSNQGKYNPGLIIDKTYSAKYAKLMYNQVIDGLSIHRRSE